MHQNCLVINGFTTVDFHWSIRMRHNCIARKNHFHFHWSCFDFVVIEENFVFFLLNKMCNKESHVQQLKITNCPTITTTATTIPNPKITFIRTVIFCWKREFHSVATSWSLFIWMYVVILCSRSSSVISIRLPRCFFIFFFRCFFSLLISCADFSTKGSAHRHSQCHIIDVLYLYICTYKSRRKNKCVVFSPQV